MNMYIPYIQIDILNNYQKHCYYNYSNYLPLYK